MRRLRWSRGGAALAAGLLLAAPVRAQSAYEQLQTFSGVLNQIRQNYVDSVTSTQLVRAAIEGMLASLDPHSYFMPHEQGLRFLAYQAGQLAGLGIIMSEVDGLPTIQAVLPESPADRAGIAPGDRLVRVNDTVVVGIPFQSLQGRLIGNRGSKIRLLLERGRRWEPDSVKVTLKFDYLEPHSVSMVGMAAPGTGYLRLQQFFGEAAKEVEDGVRSLKSKGATRLILDLRGNPGGLVYSAVEIASIFFSKETLVFRTEGRRRSANQSFFTEKDGRFRDLPLIVLIDEGSASASEALAGSFQDHDRALIMGRRSFGKALMQRAFEVPPSGDLVWLTIGHVLTPSGRFVQRRYTGLDEAQYLDLAGQGGAEQDTLKEYRTDRGRLIRGGGGILPDVVLPGRIPLPAWFSAAADSGFHDAVSDSVAGILGQDAASRARFSANQAEWQQSLLSPFLARVRSRLGVSAEVDSAVARRLSHLLAARTVQVRWGGEALQEFLIATDPDVQAALGSFARMEELLR